MPPAADSAPAAASAPSAKVYRGSAFDTERHAPAYTEEHTEKTADGKPLSTHTLFQSPGGEKMAERDLDFSHYPFKPDYLYRDLRNGYEEGSKDEAGRVHVHFRDHKDAALREKSLSVPEFCVVNGGVGNFVKANWAGLAAGKRLAFNMVVPARLDFFRFAAYRDAAQDLPEKETGGRKSQAIVIEPQATFLRMLLPAIIMHYDVKTLRLVRYQGIVNVADAKGRSLRVRTDYPGMGP